MSAYEPFLFEDADEEEAPPDLPKSKDTPAKVTKVAKLEPGDSENFSDFSGFSGFSGRHLAFARNPENRSDPNPDRHDRLCYLCASFTRSPYGFPLGLCQQHGDRIQHSTSQPTRFGCDTFMLRQPGNDSRTCLACRHYSRQSPLCDAVNTGCPYPTIPPCTGTHFQPKGSGRD